MIPLYHRSSVYRLDRQAMTLDAQPPRQLMARAAQAAWNSLTERWPEAMDLLVLAGPGNNGGDAWALALLAKRGGLRPRVLYFGDLQRQSDEARSFREACERQGIPAERFAGALGRADLIVDGLLGIGLDKPLQGDLLTLIEAVNGHPAPVLALDLPSGLHAETGRPLPVAIRAERTVTFIARKTGQFLADGPDHCGQLLFDDLGLSSAARRSEPAALGLLEASDLAWPIPRPRNSHKYDYGSILVVGGDRDLAGAALMCGLAALKAGAGLVRLCLHPEAQGSQLALAPELMCCNWDELDEHLQRASLLVVGPGLGRGAKAMELLCRLQSVELPMLIDADALQADFLEGLSAAERLLTPHAGEAARLLGQGSEAVSNDRLHALDELVEGYRAGVLLKGQDTLLAAPGVMPLLCNRGHPGMATAGMGDALAGMIAGLWAQGMEPLQAAATAAYWQGEAARRLAEREWSASLTATRLIGMLAQAAQGLQETSRG